MSFPYVGLEPEGLPYLIVGQELESLPHFVGQELESLSHLVDRKLEVLLTGSKTGRRLGHMQIKVLPFPPSRGESG